MFIEALTCIFLLFHCSAAPTQPAASTTTTQAQPVRVNKHRIRHYHRNDTYLSVAEWNRGVRLNRKGVVRRAPKLAGETEWHRLNRLRAARQNVAVQPHTPNYPHAPRPFSKMTTSDIFDLERISLCERTKRVGPAPQ